MRRFLVSLVFVFLLIPVLAVAADEVPRGVFVQLPKGIYFIDSTLHITVQWMDYAALTEVFHNVDRLNYKKLIIDLFSYGGSVFEAMGMVGLIEEQELKGITVEVRGRGIIASAGLIIMMAGTPGYRFIDRNAFVMFHEMWKFKFLQVESVSDEEQSAKISRKIQDAINRFITKNTKITQEELSQRIIKKELWCTASEAVELGFADAIIGQKVER